tara:strand:+ start:355 stop:543 length:189 start_codon:yes stop_codon:yes gene_type:complete
MQYRRGNVECNLLHHGFDICVVEYASGEQVIADPDHVVDIKTGEAIKRRTRPSRYEFTYTKL